MKPVRSGSSVCVRCGYREDTRKAVKDATLIGSFPYESMKPHQREVIEQIGAALGSKRFIILEGFVVYYSKEEDEIRLEVPDGLLKTLGVRANLLGY